MSVIEDFKQHAISVFPNEAVGVVKGGKYIPLDNKSQDPSMSFVVNADIFDNDDVTEILHTHTDGTFRPSYDDMRTQISLGIPMGIMGMYGDTENDEYNFSKVHYLGNLRGDYLGLPYIFGINDCYTLVRNWYYTHRDIELLDFPRRWEFWKTQNLLIDNVSLAGFKEISVNEVEAGDVFFCTFHGYGKYPVHMGVYVGDNTIEHHPSRNMPVDYQSLSKREPIQRYIPSITQWYRYVGFNGGRNG